MDRFIKQRFLYGMSTLAGYDPNISTEKQKTSEEKKWYVKFVMHVWVMVIEEYSKTHQQEKNNNTMCKMQFSRRGRR